MIVTLSLKGQIFSTESARKSRFEDLAAADTEAFRLLRVVFKTRHICPGCPRCELHTIQRTRTYSSKPRKMTAHGHRFIELIIS